LDSVPLDEKRTGAGTSISGLNPPPNISVACGGVPASLKAGPINGSGGADVAVGVLPRIVGEQAPETVVMPNGDVMGGAASGATTSGEATAEDETDCGVRIAGAGAADTIESVDGGAVVATAALAPVTGHTVMLPSALVALRPPRLGAKVPNVAPLMLLGDGTLGALGRLGNDGIAGMLGIRGPWAKAAALPSQMAMPAATSRRGIDRGGWLIVAA
jgi:hypothetical protein